MRRFLVLALCSLFETTSGVAGEAVSFDGVDLVGRVYRLDQTRGHAVAITLVSRYTHEELERINQAIESRLDDRRVAAVTVVDLIGIPRLFHDYARRKIAERTVHSRIQYVIDDRGRWRQRFDAQPDKRVDIIVISPDGAVRGHFVGEGQLDEALHMLDQLRDSVDRQ